MPIQIGAQVQRLDEKVYQRLTFEVMGRVFDIHNELGRFFDARIYKQALKLRYPGIELDVPVEVSFDGFQKKYWLDTLVEGGAVFDLKSVEFLTNRHRSLLMQSLMLADLAHAKLINFHAERVEHAFVNNSSRLSNRRDFNLAAEQWSELGDKPLQPWFTAFLRSIGAGLDISLYEEAISYWYGGEEYVLRDVEVTEAKRVLGAQKFRLLAPRVAFKVTTSLEDPNWFEQHVRKIFVHTRLEAVQWINVTRNEVVFRTLRR